MEGWIAGGCNVNSEKKIKCGPFSNSIIMCRWRFQKIKRNNFDVVIAEAPLDGFEWKVEFDENKDAYILSIYILSYILYISYYLSIYTLPYREIWNLRTIVKFEILKVDKHSACVHDLEGK